MARRIGLGRGFDALLDNNDSLSTPEQIFKQSLEEDSSVKPAPSSAKSKAGDIIQIPVNKLVPNPGQPRKNFDETELNELADSIKTYGIIQPVIAANAGDGSYIIIAGERRTRAAGIAGLETVPVIVRDYTDQKRLEVSLIENIQRTDLNPIEEAAAYKNLMDFSEASYGKPLSQDELAARVGKNRSTIANALRLLKLSVEIQKSIEDGTVSPGHARALLSVTNTNSRNKLYKELLSGSLSVRDAEKRAAELNAAGDGSSKDSKNESGKILKAAGARPPELDAMAEKFISKLGTKVTIDGDMKKGRIIIDYYSMEDLERLYEILG